MKYVFEKSSVISILEEVKDTKFIRQQGKIYKFFINNGSLMLNIFEENGYYLYQTHVIEKNVKSDFDVYNDEINRIHIVAINKKYDLIYIRFDGTTWVKEDIYRFVATVGIPSTPVIKVYGSTINIILSFIKVSNERMWSIRSYIRKNGSWDFRIIDRGPGLCYSQPSFCLDKFGNIHLVYRHLDKNSNLKYSYFNKDKGEWKKSQFILYSNIDRYRPYVFINKIGIVYVCWIEIKDNEVFLCSINKNFAENYFKIDITDKLNSIGLFDNTEHVLSTSQWENRCDHDLCCKRQTNLNLKFKIDEICGEDFNVNTNVRLFLDVKRELECQLDDLRKNMQVDTDNYIALIDNLKRDNEKIIKENEQKDMEINEMSNAIKSILHENDGLRRDLEELKSYMEGKPTKEQEELQKDSNIISHEIPRIKHELMEKNRYRFIKKILDFMKKEA